MSLCSDGLSSDQYFLVNFIMSNYLGPDVYSENPRNSASQRLAKRLYPYTLKQIGTSSLTVAQLQNLYYYVMRNAKSSLLLRPDMIYMYVKGYLPLEPVGKFPQFTSFFPTNLHPQKRYSPSHEIVKGIVVIDDPAVAFISKEEIQRFRSLSRLDGLKIDRVMSLSPQRVEKQDCLRNGEATSNGLVANQYLHSSATASCVISKTPEMQGKELDCSRNGEATSNGLVLNQDLNSSAEVICKTPESQGKKQGCSRNGEETSNGLVLNQDLNSSAEVICKTPESQGKKQGCSRNGEETSNGLVLNQDLNSSAEVIRKTPESQGKKPDCSRNGEEAFNGLVANQDLNSSAEVQEMCKRKKKDEAVASCLISKTPERVTKDIPESQGPEQDCSKNKEETSTGLIANQEDNSSVKVRETCKRKKEEEAVVACHGPPESQGTEEEGTINGEATSKGLVSDQDCNSLAETQETCKRKKEEEEAVAGHASCGITKTPDRFRETYKRKRFKNSSTKATNKKSETLMEKDKTDQPIINLALVPAPPDMKECDTEPPVVITGTASKATRGPPVGVIDIGVNKVAYFFQVALPGVRKDYGEFSCEIESDGKVTLEGLTTTGVKTVERHSRVFKMKKRKLCPPGPFKLSFSLPGPVDPRLFSPNFRSDGIFEAVIIRHKQSR